MLLLCYLLLQNQDWRDREIRLLFPINTEQERENAEKEIQEIQATARIPCAPAKERAAGILPAELSIPQQA